jgi:2,3-dihydroxybiphenyl 1,2-dioxygenase
LASVRALAYIGVRGSDLEAWRTFGTEVLGMQVSGDSTADQLLFRMDDRAHRVSVAKGAPGLDHLGFELASLADLSELVAVLRADGVEATDEPELAKARNVRHLVRAVDPAGNPVELVVAQTSPKVAFVSPTGVSFKTGSQGLGHAVIIVPDQKAVEHFYVDLLGFRLSDTIDLSMATASFFHCNARHHTLAFVQAPMNRLAHFMVEVNALEMVGRAYDVVADRGLPISMSLGMHTNDEMLSFYVKSPSGFDVEFGTNGREVDDATWTVSHYNAASYWGHKRPVQTS